MLFILAIDPLQRLLQVATARGLIYEVSRNKARLRTSLYADDAVLFIKPVKEEVARLARMLELFGGVTSLSTNVQKSSVIPIACDGLDLDEVFELNRTDSHHTCTPLEPTTYTHNQRPSGDHQSRTEPCRRRARRSPIVAPREMSRTCGKKYGE